MENMFVGAIYQNMHRGAPTAYTPPQQYAARIPPLYHSNIPRCRCKVIPPLPSPALQAPDQNKNVISTDVLE
jgi:hypothetical protein